MANEIKDVEEFGGSSGEKESEEETPEVEIPEEIPEETTPEKLPEKLFTFNGRQMTAEELHADAISLQAEYTRRTQMEKSVDKPAAKYDAKQIEEFKQFGREAGLVFKDDLEKVNKESEEKRVLNAFLDKHPEYKDQAKAREFYGVLGRFNTSIEYLAENLEEAHKKINPVDPNSAEAKVRAQQILAKRQGTGSGTGTKGKPSTAFANYSPAAVEHARKLGLID